MICTEAELHRYARRYHPLPVLMENVADFDHFHSVGGASRLSARAKSVLDAMQRLPSPRLVFSGHLAPHKVDFDLLLAVKRLRAQWSLVLIGPEWEGADLPESFARLKREPGILLAGKIDYGDLPALLHSADVLLIPYQMNSVTRHVSPLKFFEYLATGKPVVSTPLPSILKYAGQAGIATHAEGFVQEIERALADPGWGREARLELARSHTWDRRLEEISKLLDH